MAAGRVAAAEEVAESRSKWCATRNGHCGFATCSCTELGVDEPVEQAMLKGTVGVAEHLGGDSFAYVDVQGLDDPINVRIAGGSTLTEDETVGLRFDLGDVRLFDSNEDRVQIAS